MYGRPFGKSLCHAWSAGPAALLPELVLGVRPLTDGWRRFEVEPELGESRTGPGRRFPCPGGGMIVVTVDQAEVNVEVPDGLVLERSDAAPVVGPGKARWTLQTRSNPACPVDVCSSDSPKRAQRLVNIWRRGDRRNSLPRQPPQGRGYLERRQPIATSPLLQTTLKRRRGLPVDQPRLGGLLIDLLNGNGPIDPRTDVDKASLIQRYPEVDVPECRVRSGEGVEWVGGVKQSMR